MDEVTSADVQRDDEREAEADQRHGRPEGCWSLAAAMAVLTARSVTPVTFGRCRGARR